VTFTNKAAAEMRQRIEQLLGINPAGMWVGTFHGLAHRLLRAHWQEAGLVQNFQILDSDDQQRLVKRVIRELGLDEQKWPARQVQWFINGQKDEGLRPRHIQASGDLFLATMRDIYKPTRPPASAPGSSTSPNCCCAPSTCGATTRACWRTTSALPAHPGGRVPGHQRRAVRLVAPAGGWRQPDGGGRRRPVDLRLARRENREHPPVHRDFPDAETIRLEQNYRSTAGILKAANA
jgi:DNA helicase-2/ATP-dependent DNA helicase PcrA